MNRRAHLLTGVAGLLLAFHGQAHAQRQPPSQEKLQASLDKKLGKAFVKNAAWVQDYEKARETAAGSGKLILVYFTRSYSP